jgi:hypothetical protein
MAVRRSRPHWEQTSGCYAALNLARSCEVGGSSIRALPKRAALKKLETSKGRVFWMRSRYPTPEDLRLLFDRAAEHQNRQSTELLAEVRVPAEVIQTSVPS